MSTKSGTPMRNGTKHRLDLPGVLVGTTLLHFIACTSPDIPHPVRATNDEYCKHCHSGRVGAPETGHDPDTSDCTSCHKPTARGPYPALMPHRGGDETSCRLCHSDGTADATVTSHIEVTDCYSCHEAAQYGPWPPAVTHQVESPDDSGCLECHSDVEHRERKSCLACHRK